MRVNERGRPRNSDLDGSKGSCLVVEDDPALRRFVRHHLARQGWEVSSAPTLGDAHDAMASQQFRFILADVFLPDGSGFDLLSSVVHGPNAPPVIMMTGDGAVDHSLAAVRGGAADFLMKPFSPAALEGALERMAVIRRLSQAPLAMTTVDMPVEEWRSAYAPDIIGSAPSLLRMFAVIERIADTDCSVLVTGESGTGKELVARAIHAASERRHGPFVAVNCAAIPETLLESELFGHSRGAFTGATQARVGRFAAADGGTILLDEIGEMPLAIQAKLLRLLQEKEVTPLGETRSRRLDLRVIAATNRDLDQMIAERAFREDLLYRINVIQLELPALRDRRQDIPMLIRHFIHEISRRRGRNSVSVAQVALDALCAYDWPGNIRQLENVIERIVLLHVSGEVGVDDLPEKIRRVKQKPTAARPLSEEPVLPEDGIDLKDAIEHFEGSLIRQALERVAGNRNRAAALLHMNRTTLVEKLKKKELAATLPKQDLEDP